ncbi:AAA family ATPase [Paracoccus sp. S-4012]|uniref:TniB family NTP-binding protein n=1 Tax=Paracoccus sp. S-4012 TaxID=2665648 RepID=UPI0012AEEC7D|nr:TniB family NTP-binding protein [Paracoccus sp. S-4012]MRX51249.1 AAA family ATPase [Paracoccus sp. S-4012]
MPQRFSDGRETRGMMVIDGPGGRKTTLVSRALKHHPAVGESAPGGPHYIEASVPSPASLKSMGNVLLERSGYPLVHANHNARSTWETVARRFKDLGITTLCIDEAQQNGQVRKKNS